jgi:hypothetical protein
MGKVHVRYHTAACFIFSLVIILVSSQQALSGSVSLQWDAKTDAGLSGYKIYYGTASRTYILSINVGNTTTYTVNNLSAGTYYFALTAYYTSTEVESGFSNEVSTTVSSGQPVTPLLSVDSTYAGYTISAIDDGIINANGEGATTWASTESSTTGHWIEIAFPSAMPLNYATIWWAFNPYQQKYMVSQQVDIQYWDGAAFRTLGSLRPTNLNVASSTFTFFFVTTSKLRFYQPANQGPPTYTTVLWVTEIDYGANNSISSQLPAPTNPRAL